MSVQGKNAHIASFASPRAPYTADQATAEAFMRHHDLGEHRPPGA